MADKAQMQALARQALKQYPLRQVEVRFLGHSDNITFRVEEKEGAVYLLRLHRPVISYWAGERQSPELIASELTWLEALAEECEFKLQRPVHTRSGDWVGAVEIDGSPTPVTLLTWLAGEHFSPAAPAAARQVESFGALVARLHQFSASWVPPEGFSRPQYNEAHFQKLFARLLRGVDLGIFSEEVYWTLRATTQAILGEIQTLPDDPQNWGMIHADLHVGNFLVGAHAQDSTDEPEIIPIDFSFCGFGHYLFDLSVCLAGGLKADLRPAFLEGYRSVRELPESSLRAVDAYCLAGAMSYYAYQIGNPAERAWLQRRIPEIVKSTYTRFLAGERILWGL
jgi:Ser/Thr protein kinase RdoA (MazF antagonist)